jgi:acyl dehydratase
VSVAPIALESIEQIRDQVGQPAVHGPWLTIDQGMIDRFAEVTHDHQWIHVDTARAAAESPLGRTIAHGFLTLSLLSHLFAGCFTFPGRRTSLNYGFDRIRFTAPVVEGAQVRAAVTLAEVADIGAGEVRCHWDLRIEIAGSERPALVARWLVQMRYDAAA